MSVYLHVGQCGNQLGAAYWRLAAASSECQDKNYNQRETAISQQLCYKSGDSAVALNASKKCPSLSRHLFHPSTRAARCILVDSESKVVRSVRDNEDEGVASFHPAHTHVEQAGRGNNWAMGYYGPRLQAPVPVSTSLAVDHRKELLELVMDSLRREIESVECYQGSVMMHSLGGGTGSGLGCRVLESIRDTYPKAYIVTASVAPSWTRGDSPLQNYNAVLTLRCLQEVADAVIYKDNDDLLRSASYWKAVVREKVGTEAGAMAQRVSLAEINSMAAADLAGLLFPVATEDASTTRTFDFGKLLHDVCSLPVAKMLDVRSGVWRDRVKSGTRSSTSSKGSAAKEELSTALFHAPVVAQVRSLALRRKQVADPNAALEALEKLVQQTVASFPRTLHATLASSTVVRGFSPISNEANRFSARVNDVIQATFPPVPWLATMPQATLTYSKSTPLASLPGQVSATICANNGHFLPSVKHFMERAQRQFHAGAYVHWYKQHGMEDADFENAFDQCSTLVSEYETLLRCH